MVRLHGWTLYTVIGCEMVSGFAGAKWTNCPVVPQSICQWMNRAEELIDIDKRDTISSGIILSMRPANERWRYNVTPPLIGWEHNIMIPELYDIFSCLKMNNACSVHEIFPTA